MHPWPGNWVVIRRTVVNYARAAHAFSAGNKCRHCIQIEPILSILNNCGEKIIPVGFDKQLLLNDMSKTCDLNYHLVEHY